MIARVWCAGKCWKFTHAEPLPRGERRGEWLTLSLRAFLIGDLVSRVGDVIRVGIEEWIERVRA